MRYYLNHFPESGDESYTYGEGHRVKSLSIAGRDISEFSIRLAEDSRYEILGDEGFTISVKENGDLYITGGQYRGCMYGTYEFLEEFVGWRFMYDHDLTVIGAQTKTVVDCYESYEDAVYEYLYESDGIDIPADTDLTQVPAFSYRETYTTPGINDISPEYYTVKARDNGRLRGNSSFNGYGIASKAVHGLYGASQYFPNYPESILL